MFNSTHTLVGFAIARTGLDRWSSYAATTAVIASNLPDIDIVTALGNTATYLDHHRGITHSLVGIPILSLMLAFVIQKISGKRGPLASLWRLFVIALIAMSTHPLLDWMNTYGVRPFVPFSGHWYYGDTLVVIDLYLDFILLIAIVAGRHDDARRQKAAIVGLILATLYIGASVEARNIARRQLTSYVTDSSSVVQMGVSPEILSPLKWTGIIETTGAISLADMNIGSGVIKPGETFAKIPDSPVTAAADATFTGRVFLSFARYTARRVDREGDGYRVLLADCRFFGNERRSGLVAEIRMKPDLSVVSESLSFARRLD